MATAAHSTVRALYAKYSGPLYNVTRSSDGKSASIGVLSAGGFADKPAHDTFCAELDCVISNVFDQSPQRNHLGQRHQLVNASRHSVTVGKGKTPVYGMWCVRTAVRCRAAPLRLLLPVLLPASPLWTLPRLALTSCSPPCGHRFDKGFGYHVDNTTGIPTGNDPESICRHVREKLQRQVQPSARDCHSADALSPSLLKRVLNVEGGAAE